MKIQGKYNFLDSEFKKSTFSSTPRPWINCVEVAITSEAVGVRDSKNPNGYVLEFTRSEWEAFIKGVKKGEFDL